MLKGFTDLLSPLSVVGLANVKISGIETAANAPSPHWLASAYPARCERVAGVL
jgi:hypothetical protein